MDNPLNRNTVRFGAYVVTGVLVSSLAIVLLKERPAVPSAGAQGPREPEVAPCGKDLEPIGGGGCFAAPRDLTRSVPLLIYLHGRYSPENVNEELERQARVAQRGTAHGYAVLALRGMQGQCTAPEFSAWWCWPSNERNAADGQAFVDRWSTSLAEVERRAPSGQRFLLGFSNGGYFAALISSRALFSLAAVAIAHAGPVVPMTPRGEKPRVLLLDADDDPSGPEMSRLAAELVRAAWPHATAVREGGHALSDWDIDLALTFFDRVSREPWPLNPPLDARTVRRTTELDGSAPATMRPAPNPPGPDALDRDETVLNALIANDANDANDAGASSP